METRKIQKAKRKGSRKNGLCPQNLKIKIKNQTCTRQNTRHQTKKRKRSDDDDDTFFSAKKVCKFPTFGAFYSTCSKQFISKHHLPDSSNRKQLDVAAKRALSNTTISKWEKADISKQLTLSQNSIGIQRVLELEKVGKFSVNGRGGPTHNIQSFLISLGDYDIVTIIDFRNKTSEGLSFRFREEYLGNWIGYNKNGQVHHFGWQKMPQAA